MIKKIILFSAALLLCLYSSSPASAHIGKGPMPDVVAEMEYRILLEFQPEKNDIRNNLGMVLYRRNKLAEAEKEFRTVLKNDPKNFNATDALGLVYKKRKELVKAERQHKEALALKPDDVLVYFHLGEIYVATKRYTEALQSFLTALEMAEKAKLAGVAVPDLTPIEQALQELKKNNAASGGSAVH